MIPSLTGLPIELYTNKIIPFVGMDVRALFVPIASPLKHARGLIYHIALTYNSDHDLDFMAKQDYTSVCEEPTRVKACIFEILKFQIKERYPQHQYELVRNVLRFNLPQVIRTTLKPFGTVLCNVIYHHKDPILPN